MTRAPRAVAGLIAATLISVHVADALRAAEPAPSWNFSSGAEVAIACDTKAVVVATDAAKVSNGPITLLLSAPPVGTISGLWRIASAGDQHHASFATTQRAVCKDGCPLSVQGGGEIQLWAPKPNSLDKIADGEQLLLAVLKPATMALRASTFRGKDIEALEEGTCRKVTP